MCGIAVSQESITDALKQLISRSGVMIKMNSFFIFSIIVMLSIFLCFLFLFLCFNNGNNDIKKQKKYHFQNAHQFILTPHNSIVKDTINLCSFDKEQANDNTIYHNIPSEIKEVTFEFKDAVFPVKIIKQYFKNGNYVFEMQRQYEPERKKKR